MASCLIAAATMLSNRNFLWNGNHCLLFGMVNFAGLTDSQVFTNKSPFGQKILEQNSYFGHYSGFFKFVVSFQMVEYPIRNSFKIIVLHR